MIAQLFQDFGEQIQGVGDFVGGQKFAQGQGFVPFDAIPLSAIREAFDGNFKLTLDAQLQAVKELRQLNASGELPGASSRSAPGRRGARRQGSGASA